METNYSVYVVEVSVKNGENYVSDVFLTYWEAEDYIICVDKITGETHYIVVHDLEREPQMMVYVSGEHCDTYCEHHAPDDAVPDVNYSEWDYSGTLCRVS